MALKDFTSYDDIRAALGVSSDEIEDATLSLPLYEYNLKAELEEVSLTLITDFQALVGDPLTEIEQRLREAVTVFSTYAVASQLTVSLPLFSPKEISDGKAHITRYAQDPYKATIDAVAAAYAKARARLVAAYAAVLVLDAPASSYRTYFSVVPSSTDPVTGA